MGTASPPKQITRLRKFLRLVGLLTALFLAIYYFYLNLSEWVDTPMVKKEIVRRLMIPYWGSAALEKSKIILKKLEAEGWNAAVYESQGNLIAKGEHFKVHVNPITMLWREIKIARVELDKPDVHLWTDINHVFIWKKFKKPPRRLHPIFRSRAGVITARDGTFVYDYFPEPNPVHVRLENVNGTAKFTDKTPYIDATIKYLHLKFPGFDHRFDDIHVRGIADADFAQVDYLEATFLGIPLKIRGRLDGFKRKNPRMNFSLHAAGAIGNLLKYFNYDKNPPGPFELDAMVTEPTDNYTVTGTFTSAWGIVEGQKYDDATANFTFHNSDKTVQVSKFSLKMYGCRIEGSGQYAINTGNFAAKGSFLLGGRTVFYETDGHVDTDSGIITFDKLDFWTPSARVSSQGSWATKTGALKFKWQLNIRDMLAELPHWGAEDISGAMSLKGDLSGTLRNLSAVATGTINGFGWEKAMFGNGTVALRLEAGNLRTEIKTSEGETRFNGIAYLDVIRNGSFIKVTTAPLKFDIEASGIRLTPEVFTTDLSAIASGNLRGGGALEKMTGEGQMKLRRVSAWGQKVETVTADLTLKPDGVLFENGVVTLPGGETGNGKLWVDWNLNYELELNSKKVQLSSLNAVTDTGRPINGAVQVEMIGKGNFRRPRIWGNLVFSSLYYDTLNLEGCELSYNLDDVMVTIKGKQPWGISINGAYNLETGIFREFEIYFDGTDLGPFIAWKHYSDISGKITGTVILNGGEKGWDDVDYHMALTDLDLKYRAESVRNSGPIIIEIGPHGGIQDVHVSSEHGRADITGSLSPEGEWDLDTSADIDMEAIPSFVTSVRHASGKMSLNAHVTGPGDELMISGRSSVEDGSMRFRNYFAEFTEITSLMEFRRNELEIKSLKGKVAEDGDFSVTGKIFTSGLEVSGVDISLDSHKIPVQSPGTYKALISPTLTLRGTEDDLLLKGEIDVDEARYTKDVRIEKQFVEVKRETAPRRKIPKWIQNFHLEVLIADKGEVLIKNNLAEVPLKINLSITGTLSNPVVEGALEGLGGKIFYGGTVFQLERGRVDFANPLEIDPMVDVFAQTTIREYEVRLYLKGLLSHMELRLESSPALDDQNILALITFHKTIEELTQGENQALMNLPLLFSQNVSQAVGKPLEEFTGIDLLTIEARENSPGTRVTVGKQLSKRIEVQYSSEMGGPLPVQETRLIYKLTDNIWLQGSQDNLGVYSFRLNFHFLIK